MIQQVKVEIIANVEDDHSCYFQEFQLTPTQIVNKVATELDRILPREFSVQKIEMVRK